MTPLVVKSSPIPVPCGKCPACRSRRVSQWSFRITQEAEQADTAHFLTMTYAPHTLPLSRNGFGTLCPNDVTGFFKRLRGHDVRSGNGSSKPIRYYAVGEYGSKTRRPHYHALIFNASPELMLKAWGITNHQTKAWQPLGHIFVGTCTPASTGYVLKYMTKLKWRPMHVNDDRQSPFSRMSQGLGRDYLSEAMIKWHMADVANRAYCTTLDGKKIGMPRYYRNKLYTQAEAEQMVAASIVRRMTELEQSYNRYGQTLITMQEASNEAAFNLMYAPDTNSVL